MTADEGVWVSAGSVTEIGADKPRLVRSGTKRVAVFRVGDELRAVDNRCPHEGYALTQGSVTADGVLTCQWHNWKFDLADGSCLRGGEDVRHYPVRVDGGEVLVDVRDPDPETLTPGLFRSLLVAMDEVDTGRIARDTSRLLVLGQPAAAVLREGFRWGAARAEDGWDHSLATVADALNLLPYASSPDLPALTALSVVSGDQHRRPVRSVAEPADGPDLPDRNDAVAALRALVEAERADDAESLLRGLLRRGDPPGLIAGALAVLVSDHFLSFGHDAIYAQKSLEVLDVLGWGEAETVLAPQVYGTCLGTREDTLPYLARFEAARTALSGTAVASALEPAALRSLIPHVPTKELAEAVHRALAGGDVEAVLDAIVLAAADRLLAFDPSHEADRRSDVGWLDVTHTLTFASAVRDLWRRTHEPLLLRSVSHAAWFVSRAARYDAPPAPPVAGGNAPLDPDALCVAIDDAVARRDPEAALATAQGWLTGGGRTEELATAMARAALADGATTPIHIAHCIKVTRAAIVEAGALGAPTGWPLLLGALRYLAAPKVERRTLRALADAAKFVR